MRPLKRADFHVPAMLVALSVVPTFGGVARLSSVARDTTVTVDNARFLHAPIPVIVHVLSATLFSLLGAFQFSAGLRTRWPALHRKLGRLLALFGLVAGGSGLWMVATYPIPTNLQGPLLQVVRWVVGVAMVGSIAIAWSSILRRDVARHEAWMIRAYALGQGAGTQVLVLLPWMLISGETGGLTRDLLMTLSWAINVVVAELVIRRRHERATTAPRRHREGLSRSC